MAITTIIYLIFPILSYIGIRFNELNEIVLFNLPLSRIYTLFVQLAYCFVICVAYPIHMFPIFNIFQGGKRYEELNLIKFLIPRLGLIFLVFLLAFFISDLFHLIALVGCICASPLIFVIPVLIYFNYQIEINYKNSLKLLLGFCYLLIGVIGSIVGIVMISKRMAMPSDEDY